MKLITAFVCLFACTASVNALIVSGTGAVTDWGITPFTNWGPPAGVVGTGGTQNNYSPVQYPSGVGHVPSPGGATGEAFDLEAMYARVSGNDFQVLLVTSMALSQPYGGYNYRLGDLFIDTDGDDAYELALSTQDSNGRGFVGGQLRNVGTTKGIQGPHSYAGNGQIAPLVNPWTLDTGSLITVGAFAKTSYNYGPEAGLVHNTWLYEWTIPVASLGLSAGSQYRLHITPECGNDLIQLTGSLPPPPPPPSVPEPTSLVLCGAAILGLARRFRNAVSIG